MYMWPIKNKYTNAVRSTRKTFYAKKFINMKGNSNGTWKITNSLITHKNQIHKKILNSKMIMVNLLTRKKLRKNLMNILST